MLYNNQFYIQDLQAMRDKIDNQMKQIQQQSFQPQQPITQNFQLASNNSEIEGKYVENIEEVKNTFVMKTGIFTTRDFSTIWVKDVSGNIKTFNTQEVIELDEKDKKIIDLQNKIKELEGDVKDESNVTNANGSASSKKSSRVSNDKSSNE